MFTSSSSRFLRDLDLSMTLTATTAPVRRHIPLYTLAKAHDPHMMSTTFHLGTECAARALHALSANPPSVVAPERTWQSNGRTHPHAHMHPPTHTPRKQNHHTDCEHKVPLRRSRTNRDCRLTEHATHFPIIADTM